jgi:hypothetical protein
MAATRAGVQAANRTEPWEWEWEHLYAHVNRT